MMKKKILAILMASIFSVTGLGTTVIYASDYNEEEVESEEDWTSEESTNTFYVPESNFQSYYDYEIYCERMYKNGYMTEDYEWTDDAKRYIDNPTAENSETLNESAKDLVEERVEKGEMKPEDNPFLTYEEREEIKNSSMQDMNPSQSDTSDKIDDLPEPDIEEMLEEVDENKEELQEELTGSNKKTDSESDDNDSETSLQEETKSNIFGKIILSIFVTIMMIAVYYIYKKSKEK